MLHAVLHAIEQARGPVLLSDLSRELDIEPGVLQDMLQFWVRKGRLRMDSTDADNAPTSHATCGANCHAANASTCVFVAKLPTTYTISSRSRP